MDVILTGVNGVEALLTKSVLIGIKEYMSMNDRNGYRQIIASRDNVLTFGKHKGKSIYWILENDPEYILWASDVKIIQFPEEILNDAEEFMYERDEWMDYADQEYWTDED